MDTTDLLEVLFDKHFKIPESVWEAIWQRHIRVFMHLKTNHFLLQREIIQKQGHAKRNYRKVTLKQREKGQFLALVIIQLWSTLPQDTADVRVERGPKAIAQSHVRAIHQRLLTSRIPPPAPECNTLLKTGRVH